VMVEGESTIFHAINRNKESYAADLKNRDDLLKIEALIGEADVLIHNFRPGVMERLGLGYEKVRLLNPGIIYSEISGYGNEGPWKSFPGQDLLLQSISGLAWLSNNNDTIPTPMGVAVVDILAGAHLVQGILAALYQRFVSGEGALVQVSMLESTLDFQFEVLTCFYNDGNELPVRSSVNNGHAYVAAPYGIFKTKDHYLALAMGDIVLLGSLLRCDALKEYSDSAEWFSKRDEIKKILADHLLLSTTETWLSILEAADIWCSKVLDYDSLVHEEAYRVLEMELKVKTSNGLEITTTRCPITVDGRRLLSNRGAPLLGEHNRQLDEEFDLALVCSKTKA
jgi:CoA:oxalate CoA-transferase